MQEITLAVDWWVVHDNLVTLTSWMADNGYDASEVARAVEKPWSYADEFNTARFELEGGARG